MEVFMDAGRKAVIGLLIGIVALLLVLVGVSLVGWAVDDMRRHHMRDGMMDYHHGGRHSWSGATEAMGYGHSGGDAEICPWCGARRSGSAMMRGWPMMGGEMPMMQGRGMMGGGMMGQGRTVAMAVADGRVVLVSGGTLYSMDSEALGDMRSVELPDARGARSAMAATELMHALDKNGDGAISSDEAPGPGMIARFDSDGDGKVTREELESTPRRGGMMSGGMMAGSMGGAPVGISVSGGTVYVFWAGSVHAYDAATLSPKGTTELPRPSEPRE
jgi:hypothetical protein